MLSSRQSFCSSSSHSSHGSRSPLPHSGAPWSTQSLNVPVSSHTKHEPSTCAQSVLVVHRSLGTLEPPTPAVVIGASPPSSALAPASPLLPPVAFPALVPPNPLGFPAAPPVALPPLALPPCGASSSVSGPVDSFAQAAAKSNPNPMHHSRPVKLRG